jgi:hypothetical protein
MYLRTNAAKFPWKIPYHFACVCRVAIDINCQDRRVGRVDSDGSPQNFGLLHQIGRDLRLNSYDRSNGSMRIVESAGRRGREPTERNKNRNNSCAELEGRTDEAIN